MSLDNRSVSFEVRSVNEEERIIEGIATTPDVALDGMVLEPRGIEYRLPIPFLLDHDPSMPLGQVISARVSDSGIAVRIQVASPGVSAFVDDKWREIKGTLIRRLSIRWQTLKKTFDKSFGGDRITKSRWIELSAVSVGADLNAVMTNVAAARSLQESIAKPSIENPSAAFGKKAVSAVRLTSALNTPGASGQTQGKAMKDLTKHIAALTAQRNGNVERMDAIIQKAADESRSRDAAELEEFETLEAENARLDRDIEDFSKRNRAMVAAAAPVEAAAKTEDPEKRAVQQRTGRIEVKSAVPADISFARMAISMWHARNDHRKAAELCKQNWPDQPEIAMSLRAIVEAGDTTTSGWASQLLPAAQQLQQNFLDMFRTQTIIGRIPGITRVPFNVAVPLRTGAGTFQWVGEAAPKPVTSETFDRVTLTYHKGAAITVITQELARFSSPQAEELIATSMRRTQTTHLDEHFVSSTAAVSGVSPAGILNGVSPVSTTGTTPAHFRTDMFNMLNNFTASKVPLTSLVILMSETQALGLSMMVTDLGVPLYPTISAQGGTLFGMPAIVSESVGTKIIAVRAADILMASDPGSTITVSDQATLEMETTPAIGEQSPPSTQSVLKSMFQHNLLAIRCEQYITWVRARTAAVEYINANAYVPS